MERSRLQVQIENGCVGFENPIDPSACALQKTSKSSNFPLGAKPAPTFRLPALGETF
jgi:hypothetical protein